MSATTTQALEIGHGAPDFSGLLGTDGRSHSLRDFDGIPILVLVFVGNGCPTVRLYEQRLQVLSRRFRDDAQIVLVNSNNPHLSPPDTYERMVERAGRSSLPFVYLKDQGGLLARACGAICTPHAFLFDRDRRLRYRGRIDDSRTGQRVTSDDLGAAMAEVVAYVDVRVPETAPFGCAIVR